MRNKTLITALLLAASLPLGAQNVAQPQDTTFDDGLGPIEVSVSHGNSRIVDTLDTDDKFVKILIYENYTWEFLHLDRPAIDTAGFYEGWDSEKIHAFKGMPLDSLPDEVTICLADEVHPFCVPVMGSINSTFKFRRYREHQGIDIGLSVGDTVRAAFDGVVRYSDQGSVTGGYGGLVIIRHNNGLETYYAHLSKRLVKVDEMVRAGEVIGLGGSTGHSTGPHLHFETRYFGKPFDPLRVVDFENGTLRDSTITLKKHYFNVYSHYGMSDSESLAASKAAPASGKIYYKVRKGDTLGRIAKKYHTTVSKLCKLNRLSTRSILRVGQRVRVR